MQLQRQWEWVTEEWVTLSGQGSQRRCPLGLVGGKLVAVIAGRVVFEPPQGHDDRWSGWRIELVS